MPQGHLQCLILCTNSKDALITLEKPSTWEVLKKAANIRKYDSILNLCNSNEMPTGVQCHRECYQTFTMKSQLEKIFKNSEKWKMV